MPLQLQPFAVAPRSMGTAFKARAVNAPLESLDPFIYLVEFWMRAPTFDPHPHAGFSAITYLFDDSTGAMLNRDSQGDRTVIRPGDLHWTLAGAGIVHDEVPETDGLVSHGLQIFVNLPAAQKLIAPRAIRVAREAMATREYAGMTLKVVFGRLDGMDTPLGVPGDAALADVALAPGAEGEIAIGAERNAFVLVIEGDVEIGGGRLGAGEAAGIDAHDGTLALRSAAGGRVALFVGTPLREPVLMHGPFAMSNAAQVNDAIRRYQAGGMGRL